MGEETVEYKAVISENGGTSVPPEDIAAAALVDTYNTMERAAAMGAVNSYELTVNQNTTTGTVILTNTVKIEP